MTQLYAIGERGAAPVAGRSAMGAVPSKGGAEVAPRLPRVVTAAAAAAAVVRLPAPYTGRSGRAASVTEPLLDPSEALATARAAARQKWVVAAGECVAGALLGAAGAGMAAWGVVSDLGSCRRTAATAVECDVSNMASVFVGTCFGLFAWAWAANRGRAAVEIRRRTRHLQKTAAEAAAAGV